MPTGGAILLGEVARHLTSVEISCNFCPRRGKASIARLLHEHGPATPVPQILRLLSADCPRRIEARIAEPSGVHMPVDPLVLCLLRGLPEEPCKLRGLRTVLWAAGGEIPPADPAA